MKTEHHTIEEMTIEAFAEKHNLTMEVHERERAPGDSTRFYAHFKHSDVNEGRLLCGTFGNGATHEQAIAAYARRISMQMLVIDAMSASRREIQVPRLISNAKHSPPLWRRDYDNKDGKMVRVTKYEIYGWLPVNTLTGEVEMDSLHSFDDSLRELRPEWEWRRFTLTPTAP